MCGEHENAAVLPRGILTGSDCSWVHGMAWPVLWQSAFSGMALESCTLSLGEAIANDLRIRKNGWMHPDVCGICFCYDGTATHPLGFVQQVAILKPAGAQPSSSSNVGHHLDQRNLGKARGFGFDLGFGLMWGDVRLYI